MSSVIQIKVKDKIINKVVESLNNFYLNVGPIKEKNIPSNPKIKPERYLTYIGTNSILLLLIFLLKKYLK